jgi:DNA invertase Pin-like site-specific DNA recombinase
LDYAAFARRILRAMSRRVGAGDIAALPELLALADELDAAIAEAVRQLRSDPFCYSWAQIARELGVSRQAAQRRWGHLDVDGGRQVGGQPAHLR